LEFGIQILFETSFEVAPRVFDVGSHDLGEDSRNFASAKWTYYFGNEALTDIFPEFWRILFVDPKENRAFDCDPDPIFGTCLDGLVAELLFGGQIKAFVDRIFQDLGVEEFGDLPKRDFEMETRTIDMLEDTSTTIVDTGDMARRDRDEKTSDDFVREERYD
jgi:hypothetical protein